MDLASLHRSLRSLCHRCRNCGCCAAQTDSGGGQGGARAVDSLTEPFCRLLDHRHFMARGSRARLAKRIKAGVLSAREKLPVEVVANELEDLHKMPYTVNIKAD